MNDMELSKLISEIGAIDQHLQRLNEIEQQQQHRKRVKLMKQLILEIEKELKPISSPYYLEALNLTLAKVNEKISTHFTPGESVKRSLIAWVNQILRYRMIDLYRENSSPDQSLDVIVSDGESATPLLNLIPDPAFTGIDSYIAQWEEQESIRLVSKFKKYIEDDPANKLRSCHINFYPECNCQILIQRRIIKEKPDRWHDISKEYQIPYGTITSFWKRKCQPLLQEILGEFRESSYQ